MRIPALTLSVLTLAMTTMTAAADKSADHPIYDQTMTSLDGKPVELEKYRGKVLLIVNTASECGATPQYEPLQGLHEKYADKGLAVLGFPCNQFGTQEPGTSQEITQFCQENYGVKFDMFEKIDVNGKQAAPLYAYLTSEQTGLDDTGEVRWNFEKFLVDKDGRVIKRFRTRVEPDSPEVIAAIEAALK
jgi:glutathione peroxidase